MIDFSGVDDTFIDEYCQDNLQHKQHIPQICGLASLFTAFNLDMLQAMVEEMNRYGEAPMPVLRYLNIRPEIDITDQRPQQFDVKLWVNHTIITVQDKKLIDTISMDWKPTVDLQIQLVYHLNEDNDDNNDDDDNNNNNNNKSTIPGLDVAAIQQIRRNHGVSSSSSFDKSNQSSIKTATVIEFSPCDLI
jgi:hypothetical protein